MCPQIALRKFFFGMRCAEGDIYKVIKALEGNHIVEFYMMKLQPDDIYTFVPDKIDGTKFCEAYEREQEKKSGCFCSVVGKVMDKIKRKK